MNPLLHALESRAKEAPEDILVFSESQQLSAQSLIKEAQQLAAQLKQHNIQILALYANNSPSWVTVDLACQLANVCLLPLPTFFSIQQLHYAIESSGADCIIANTKQIKSLLPKSLSVTPIQLDILSLNASMNSWKINNPAIAVMPLGTDKITFTSGSTGHPKGVCLSNDAIMSVAQAILQRIAHTQLHHLSILPLSTLLENIGGVYAALLSGGSVTVLSPDTLGIGGSSTVNVNKLIHTISQTQPNSMILTPEILKLLIAAIKNNWQPPASLIFIAVGGGKVSPEILQQAIEFGLPVYEGYGLSECASVVSLNSPTNNRPGSIGKPLDHINVELVDNEICVSGNTFLGYLNETDSWHNNTVKTGDLGYFDSDGYLYINGRKKNLMISSFGRNIHPEWLESEIVAHPAITQCVVFGDDKPYCTALIASHSNTADDTIQQWIRSANQTLPDYARIKHWHHLSQPLSRQSGLLTANGRPIRACIQHHYQSIIGNLYPVHTEV
jgi:long-subunit acyl-CoA synthetase (AMP-forming)